MDDLNIIESCLIGDVNQFSKLVDKYKSMVYNLCYRMCHNRVEAEDLTQESFLRAFQYLKKYDPTHQFSTWLYQVSLNIIRDKLKKKKIETYSWDQTAEDRHHYQSAMKENSSGNPEEAYKKREEKELLERSIGSLPLSYREVIILRHFQGLSYHEIAMILKLPLSTVKTRLYRARQQLQEMLHDLL